ncbi:hypothetical protein HA466_0226590 [Hirschfeldia incana]|nr:hypothetical protein HA466_0226590 [Hirschfeldia incana]
MLHEKLDLEARAPRNAGRHRYGHCVSLSHRLVEAGQHSKRCTREIGFLRIHRAHDFLLMSRQCAGVYQERYIFLRETTRNAYRTSSYVISHSIVFLPQLIASSLVFASITFWTVGLRGGLEGFVFYCLIIYASFWSGSSIVTFISGLVPLIMLSYMVIIAYVAYCLLLSGFYVVCGCIPSYWIWFHYISPIKYPYEAVLINEFDDPSRCFVKGVQVFDVTLLEGVSDTKKMWSKWDNTVHVLG